MLSNFLLYKKTLYKSRFTNEVLANTIATSLPDNYSTPVNPSGKQTFRCYHQGDSLTPTLSSLFNPDPSIGIYLKEPNSAPRQGKPKRVYKILILIPIHRASANSSKKSLLSLLWLGFLPLPMDGKTSRSRLHLHRREEIQDEEK